MGQDQPPRSGIERYRVDDLVIDVGTRCANRGAVVIPLPGLTFDLLLELIREAPNLVTHEELMERVWPDLVVNPETVNQRIKLLRKALGDDAHAPRYVVGVRGRGWRLAVVPEPLPPDNQPVPHSIAEPASQAIVPRTGRRWFLPRRAGIAVALLVALVAGYGLVEYGSPRVDRAPGAKWAPSSDQSIAVLPFLSLSNGADDELIALGISENVLHQLAQVPELQVIARTSSFAFGGVNLDVREIGRALDTRHLLEGSVQRDGENLRVIAQLIDATSGEHVWSLRFDESMQDLFLVQDGISSAVAEALAASVGHVPRVLPESRGTNSLDAWLDYQQGSRWLMSRRREDLVRGRQRFESALRKDPAFAAAHVGLAEAMLLAGFHDASEFWFMSGVPLSDADAAEVRLALESAVALDPRNGDAYIARAWLTFDPHAAEADYRKGLELNPNSAAGFERLARRLFFFPDTQGSHWDPDKRAEAFTLIDHAAQLDPLAPSVHLTKALMLLYGRGDAAAAEGAILRSLEQDPNYFPALERLGELRWCCQGEFAEAVKYLEAALSVEPAAAWTRHFLIRTYLDLSDIDAAERVASALPEEDTLARVPIALARGDWERAVSLVNTSNTDIITGLDAEMVVSTMLVAAIRSGRPDPAAQQFADWIEPSWTGVSDVQFNDGTHNKRTSVALGALLIRGDQPMQGRQLLEAALKLIHREAIDQKRGYLWYGASMPAALALLGRTDEAIDALLHIESGGFLADWWYLCGQEPAFETLHADSRFKALCARAESNALRQRDLLDAMRQRGEVPAL